MAAANGDGPAGHRAAANATSRAMVQEEVWHQLHRHLPDTFPAGGASALTAWSLDPDITFGANGAAAGKGWPMRATDGEPLLINTVGSLTLRPNATTEVPNLFLAADFVRTTTDVACMEAANEAARRAVNGILSAEARTDRVPLYDLKEWWLPLTGALQAFDCKRAERGEKPLGWDAKSPPHDASLAAHIADVEHSSEDGAEAYTSLLRMALGPLVHAEGGPIG